MRNRLLIAVGILLLAAFLRLTNLNSLPVFADESIYVRWAQVMRAESSLRFLPLSDGKQPLYMWAIIPLLKVIADPLVAARTLSAIAGLSTVVGVGTLTFLLFKSWRGAVISAALYATLPYAVFFDRMAMVDGMLTMWLVWTAVFFLLAVKHIRLDMAMLAGFSLGFAWLTKSPAMFGFGLLPTILLLAPSKKLIRAALLLIPSFIIALGMYNILRLGPEFHQIALRNKDYVFSLSEVVKHPLDPFTPHLGDVLTFYLYLATPLGLLLILWGIGAGKWEHWPSRLVLATWWAGPILVEAAIAKTFTARYLLFTLPYGAILATHAIEHIGDQTKKHRLSWAAAGVLIAVSLVADIVLITNPQSLPLPIQERTGYLEQWTAGYGLKAAAEHIRQVAKQGPVLVGSEGYFGTPFNALQMYLNDVPNVRVIGIGVWVGDVSQDLIKAKVENEVFLVVNSSRFHIDDPEKAGLELIASYPKAVPATGTQEYLLFFKVQ